MEDGVQRLLPIAVIIVPMVVGGCSSGSAVLKEAPANTSQDCPSKIQVFGSKEEVTRPYETLCMVDAQTSGIAGNTGNINLVLNKGKKRACECGADAVIVTKLEPTQTGMGGAVMTGLAIRFKGDVK